VIGEVSFDLIFLERKKPAGRYWMTRLGCGEEYVRVSGEELLFGTDHDSGSSSKGGSQGRSITFRCGLIRKEGWVGPRTKEFGLEEPVACLQPTSPRWYYLGVAPSWDLMLAMWYRWHTSKIVIVEWGLVVCSATTVSS